MKSSLLILLFSFKLYSAACCQGGAVQQTIKLNDSDFELRLGYANQTLLADAGDDGIIQARPKDEIETIKTTRVSALYALNDLWQVNLTFPWQEQSKFIGSNWDSRQGLGDPSLTIAYEVHPLYTRSSLPRGFVYFNFKAATAPSLFTSTQDHLLDARGTGHEEYRIGTLWQKHFKNLIVTGGYEFMYRPGKTFNENSLLVREEFSTRDGWEQSFNLNFNYVLTTKWQTFILFQHTHSNAKLASNFSDRRIPFRRQALAIGLGYQIENNLNLITSFRDEILLNSSYNTTIAQSLGINLVWNN